MLRYSLKYYLVPEGGKDYKAVTEKPDVQVKNAWNSWVLQVCTAVINVLQSKDK